MPSLNAASSLYLAISALAIAGWAFVALVVACNAWTRPEATINALLRLSHRIEGLALSWRAARRARQQFEIETRLALAAAMEK